jgi:protein phosphatase
MKLEHAAQTDVGLVRDLNEDAFIVEPSENMYLVADGMGGQAAGEIASAMACEKITDFIVLTSVEAGATWPTSYDNLLSHSLNRLQEAFRSANRAIYEAASTDPDKQGMGTTGVCALFEDSTMYLAHVGDSRAYLIRNGSMEQLTRDHSWIHDQVESGLMTEEEAQDHPYRNIITRALGAGSDVRVDLSEHPLEDNDLMLLCSDGLTAMVSDDQIMNLLKDNAEDLDAAVKAFIDAANASGGKDNITAILIRYSSGE